MRVVRLDSLSQFAAVNLLSDLGAVSGKIIIPSCVQVHIIWTLTDGKTARNVLGLRVASNYTPTPTSADLIRAQLVTGANWSTYASFLAPGTVLTRVDLRDMRAVDQPFVSSTGAAAPGVSTGTALPSEVAAVVTLRTNLTGPGNRGRVYLPGFATNALGAGDVIASGAMTAIAGFVTNITNGMAAAPGEWVLMQKPRAGYTSPITGTVFPARAAGTISLASKIVRDNHWDSQRRRGLK